MVIYVMKQSSICLLAFVSHVSKCCLQFLVDAEFGPAILRKECRLGEFENKLFRRTFRPKRIK
jgi:hypothetical protein